MNVIRVESSGETGIEKVYSWLGRHRGQVVQLDPDNKLTLGTPISGARAVIVAAVLDNGVGGVLRALSTLAGSVRFVFDIRPQAGLDANDVRAIGAGTLDAITRHIADDDVARVA